MPEPIHHSLPTPDGGDMTQCGIEDQRLASSYDWTKVTCPDCRHALERPGVEAEVAALDADLVGAYEEATGLRYRHADASAYLDRKRDELEGRW